MGKFVADEVQLRIRLNQAVPGAYSDLTPYTTSTGIEMTSTAPDITTFDSDGWMEFLAGLRGWTVSADFLQDFAAGAFDSIMWPIFNQKCDVQISPYAGAVAVGNPYFTGTTIFNGYPIISGSVGDAAGGSLGIQGTGALVRTTS